MKELKTRIHPYPKHKICLLHAGISQRQVMEECRSRGLEVNLSRVNYSLDSDICQQIQDIAMELCQKENTYGNG